MLIMLNRCILIVQDSTETTSYCVLAVPKVKTLNKDSLNVTLSFASPEWLVLADGSSCYHVVYAANRNENRDWQVVCE